MEGLKGILKYQFDLEILLRLQEKKLIELELFRAKQIKEILEFSIINEHKNLSSSEIKNGSPLIEKKGSFTDRTEQLTLGSTGLSTVSYSKSSIHQFEIRPDGSVIKLRCPVCLSDKFKSMLGYLNHCRIHCKVIFSSPEDRQTRGGVPVDIDQVPQELFISKHPSMVKQEHDLAIIRSEVSNNIFDENKLPGIKESTAYSYVKIQNQDTDIQEDICGQNILGSSMIDEINSSNSLVWNSNRFYVQKSIIIGNDATCLAPQAIKSNTTQHLPTHKWNLYIRPGDYYSLKNKDLSDNEIYGDLNKLIKSVEVYLHPNYNPSMVELKGPIYELELAGWGEFPIRIVLNFWDKERNNPVEFIHHLRIFMACHQGKLTPGPERLFNVDIDKDTDLSLSRPINLDNSLPNVKLEPSKLSSETMIKSQFEILSDFCDSIPPIPLENASELKETIRKIYPFFSLSIGEIQNWLLTEHKYNLSSMKIDVKTLKYCRFCGVSHVPQDIFETLQKNCSQKPKKVRFSSKSSASLFLDKFSKLQQKVVKNFDYNDSSWITYSPNSHPCLSYNFVYSIVNGKQMTDETISILAGTMISYLKSLISLSTSRLKRTYGDKRMEIDCLTPWHVYSTIIEKEDSSTFLTNSLLSL